MISNFGDGRGPTLGAFLFVYHTRFLDVSLLDLWKCWVEVLLRQNEIPEFQVNQPFQPMTVRSCIP